MRALADSLTNALLNELPPDRAYDREALQAGVLPDPVAHFLRRTVKEQVEREMARLHGVRTGWVNYEASAVKEAQNALVRAAGQHAQVPADAWKATLRRAVRETGAYLVRPRATLVRFVFADEETASAHHILQRVRFFSPYSYFANVLHQYVERRNIETMDAERFAGMLRRIDQQMTGEYTPAQWSQLLSPLFAFVDRVPEGPNRAVPVSLLHAFFEEKERDDLTARLQQAQASGTEALTPDELRRLLEAAGEAQGSAASAEKDSDKLRRQETPRQSAPEEGPVPLWKQFQPGGRGGVPKKKQDRPSISRRPPDESSASEKAAPRWQQFQPGASSSSSDPLEELEHDVLGGRGAKNRSYFVNNLFGGSRSAYRETLRRLREVTSWSEAQQVVAQEVFRKRQVNIYSDAAVSFTDAVQQRFR